MEALAWITVASIVLACLITLITEPRPKRRVPVYIITTLPENPRRIDHRTPEQREADQSRVDRLGFP